VDSPQLSLDGDSLEPPSKRVEMVARIFAGFRWPHVGFDRLTKPQQRHVFTVAREALTRLHEEVE
jgi:hypothetical protein